jgi:hypothetical protein
VKVEVDWRFVALVVAINLAYVAFMVALVHGWLNSAGE